MNRYLPRTLILILVLSLAACIPTPGPAATATPIPSSTSVPTATPIPSPTATSTRASISTPTPTAPAIDTDQVTVERIDIRILESFPVQVQIAVYGSLPDACSLIDGVEQVRDGNVFRVTLSMTRRPDARCAPQPTPFEQVLPLDVLGLQAGTYTVNVHGVSGTFELAVPNVPIEVGSIGGRVWHDLCGLAGGEGGTPVSPSAGCVSGPGGGYEANGILEAGEPGIEGLIVTLGQGGCPSAGLAATTTDADGLYGFAGLEPGTYCVAVDALQEPNVSILVPGAWTSPATDQGIATVTVDVGPGAQRTDVDLGWGYQFLPVDALAEFEAQLVHAILTGNDARMRDAMGDAFAIGYWRSEGNTYAPGAAITELRQNHLPAGASLTVDREQDARALLDGLDPYAVFGPRANIARILYLKGWGPEGRDEALLYIARDPAGSYYWYGVLVASGGFAPSSTAFTWYRRGGIAGFCDGLTVQATGEVAATTCAGTEARPLGRGRLTGERLAQVQAWMSELQAFEFEHTDAATADAMTVGLAFYGTGEAKATEAQMQAIRDFAAQLFAELGHVAQTDVRYVLARQDVTMYSGPYGGYEAIRQIGGGQTALVTGKSIDGNWWRVICPDDTVGSCWVSADPQRTQPTATPPFTELKGGLLVTFAVNGEQFQVWATNPQAIQQILDLQAGKSVANIPNGRILRGPGLGGYNLPWNWHLDGEDIHMAELTVEVCDGEPSYVERRLDEYVDVVQRYCPWAASLVKVQDLRSPE